MQNEIIEMLATKRLLCQEIKKRTVFFNHIGFYTRHN